VLRVLDPEAAVARPIFSLDLVEDIELKIYRTVPNGVDYYLKPSPIRTARPPEKIFGRFDEQA